MTKGGPELLNDPVAERLLGSKIPARLAYTWKLGSPRVVPIWFHRNGSDIVMGTPPRAPKLHSLKSGDPVALTIDSNESPYAALTIRGVATVTENEGVVPEFAAAAMRYFGKEQGESWVAQFPTDVRMYRIPVRPDVVTILDFTTRFSSALSP